jgi:L-ribulose-5-phosphate 3-epimerase
MELSINLEYVRKRRNSNELRDFAQAVELCKDAGFRYVDFSSDYKSKHWEYTAHQHREILDAAGLSVVQTHAPFNRYKTYHAEDFKVYSDRLFAISKILGAEFIVMHADEYQTVDHYDEKEILAITYNYMAPYVEYAIKNNLSIAIENVFEDNVAHCPQFDGKSRFTARINELLAIIERFNTPYVSCCWDFGHAMCAYGIDGMLDALKQVGSYVSCTHVHDNYYGKDLHLAPFLGDVNWEENMQCLFDINYKGKFTFEFVYGSIPDALLPMWLKNIVTIGQYLVNLPER